MYCEILVYALDLSVMTNFCSPKVVYIFFFIFSIWNRLNLSRMKVSIRGLFSHDLLPRVNCFSFAIANVFDFLFFQFLIIQRNLLFSLNILLVEQGSWHTSLRKQRPRRLTICLGHSRALVYQLLEQTKARSRRLVVRFVTYLLEATQRLWRNGVSWSKARILALYLGLHDFLYFS